MLNLLLINKILIDRPDHSIETILIFATDEFLRLLFRSEVCYADGTFYISPYKLKQFFSIHVMMERRSISCLYATFTHKSQRSYTALLNWLSTYNETDLLPNETQPIAWRRILTDFESGLLPAISAHDFGNDHHELSR